LCDTRRLITGAAQLEISLRVLFSHLYQSFTMAEAFIGMTINVILRAPSHATLSGRVVNIQGQTLLLEDVYFHGSGQSVPSWSVPSAEIADLSVVETKPSARSAPNSAAMPGRPGPASFAPHTNPPFGLYRSDSPYGTPLPVRTANAATIADPAILSYQRPDFAIVQEPVAEVEASLLRDEPVEIGDGLPHKQTTSKVAGQQTPANKPKRGKGWRSTPLLEDATQPPQDPETPSRASQKNKKNAKAKRVPQQQQAVQNGWATEDATDIQDLGDFDFEANHAKFDKKSVFDQIRNEDTTADEDRLVSHNRLARPGTNGGKNLHPTENVLSPPLKQQADPQDSLSDADTEVIASGRHSRQSARSRTSSRQPPRRSIGAVQDERSLTKALKAIPSAINPLSASIMSASSHRSNSSLRNAAIRAGSVASPLRGTFQQQPHFRIRSTQQVCPVLSSEPLRHIEVDTITTVGINADTITELAARGIAQAMTASAFRVPVVPGRRNSKESVSARPSISAGAKPVIVILVGNHNKGARALAAARQLYGRGYKILISVTNFAKPETWNHNIKKHIKILQTIGRKAFRVEGWASTSAQIKRLNAPPTLILDALLDGIRYGDIQEAQQAIEVREMIDWMNRSRAAVMSVACPSGYDAETGETTVMEGEPLAVKPDKVLALGAPVRGLLEAAQDGEGWAINVLDIGIAPATKGEETVPFGSEWSVEIEFSGGGGEIDTH